MTHVYVVMSYCKNDGGELMGVSDSADAGKRLAEKLVTGDGWVSDWRESVMSADAWRRSTAEYTFYVTKEEVQT